MPSRESEFIAIFADARRRSATARFSDRAAEQLSLEQHIAKFMRAGQDVHDWVGVIKDLGAADGGYAWLEVAIAPGLTLSTLHSTAQDKGYQTLIPSFSPMQALMMHKLSFGQPIMFDASMLIYDLSRGEDVDAPVRLIVRFWKLRPVGPSDPQ